jgi:molecular chaperone HscB
MPGDRAQIGYFDGKECNAGASDSRRRAQADPNGAANDRIVQACWSCQGPVTAGEPFCPSCKAVQAPGQADHFQRLGVERGFDVDVSAIEKTYFQMQRLLHPDRFATRTAKEKTLSQQQATSLNDAYETLKDPLERAVYLARLMGLNVLKEGCNALTDPVILMEAMEMREALAEAETAEDVGDVTKRAQGEITDCEAELSLAFKSGDLDAVGTLITRLKYLRKLADETRFRRAELRGGG